MRPEERAASVAAGARSRQRMDRERMARNRAAREAAPPAPVAPGSREALLELLQAEETAAYAGGSTSGLMAHEVPGIIAEWLEARDRETAELTRRATNDPGAFTRRGIEDGTEYGERLDRWQTRAIETAITTRPPR